MSTENMSRGSTWASDEVSLLISIWADEKIQQQLDSCSRKRPIFEKIAKRLEAEGKFMCSYQQIKEKIKQLKKCHKKLKTTTAYLEDPERPSNTLMKWMRLWMIRMRNILNSFSPEISAYTTNQTNPG